MLTEKQLYMYLFKACYLFIPNNLFEFGYIPKLMSLGHIYLMNIIGLFK